MNFPRTWGQKQRKERNWSKHGDTQQHVESLSSLGLNVTEEILVQNLENKLYKTTADKWEETLERGVFPSLEKMLGFLYKNIARLSKRDSENSDKMINEAEYNKGIRTQKKRKVKNG